MSESYSIPRGGMGYPGRAEKLRQLRGAGITARPAHTPYVGHVGIEVFGDKRVQRRASRILFGS